MKCDVDIRKDLYANTVMSGVLSTPLILAGFRLQSTTTILFNIFSSGTKSTKPDTIVLGLGSPRSIFSTYNFSASGCLDTSTILPILISSLYVETSSGSTGLFPLTALTLAGGG